MSKQGDTMPDLTLNEYKGISEKKLARILKEEARKICGVDSLETNSRGAVNYLRPLLHLIKTKIHRGPAWVVVDNYERFFELKDDDISIIRKSKNTAKFIYVHH